MEVGFETIGNATIIVHDVEPILVTDPWIEGPAYFGSWGLSHEIPEAQRQAILAAQYIWISHGHPDHLSGDSMAKLRDKQILLPDHVGGRIHQDLTAQGFSVQVLPDRRWVQLSPRVRVMCLADYNQDAVLLVDVNGKLVVNLNDSSDRGQERVIKKEIARYPVSFLLALSGYGDADMINYFREDGTPIPPRAATRTPPGQSIARRAEALGVRYFIPSSSMHRYQRTDSAWASQYTTPLEDYAKGFSSDSVELLPAFVRYDCQRDSLERIEPREQPSTLFRPQDFGDDWSEELEPEEKTRLERYFRSFRHLYRTLDFVRFRVGGQDLCIEYNRRSFRRGLTFEVPRASLMSAVQWEIFDDLLIGNFMKTTLHGEWGPDHLYPDFSPWVAKYGDNGRAKTDRELTAYFEAYRKRDPLGHLRHTFDAHCLRPAQAATANFLRARVGSDSQMFKLAKNAYWGLRRLY